MQKERKRQRRLKSAGSALGLALALLASCRQAPERLAVKGLYLGMSLDKATVQVEALYRQIEGDRFTPLHWIQWDSYSAHTNRAFADDITLGNSDSGLRYITFNPGLVDKLFGSSALTAEQLSREFAKIHDLPDMKHGSRLANGRTQDYWEYVCPCGWKACVLYDKTLVLKYWRSEENEKW